MTSGPQAPAPPPLPPGQGNPYAPGAQAPLAAPGWQRSPRDARPLAGFLDLDYSDSGPWGPERPSPPPSPPSFLPAPGGEAGAAPAGKRAGRRRRLTARQRRSVEAAALVLLLPLALGVQWYDETNQIRKGLEPDETITVVARNKPATLAHARWVLRGRVNDTGGATSSDASDRSPTKPRDATTITLSLGVTTLDKQAAKEASTSNLRFRLVDRAGNEWTAQAEYKVEDNYGQAPPVGKEVPVAVTGEVPRAAVSSLVLDVVQAGPYRPKGPVHVLRFAH